MDPPRITWMNADPRGLVDLAIYGEFLSDEIAATQPKSTDPPEQPCSAILSSTSSKCAQFYFLI